MKNLVILSLLLTSVLVSCNDEDEVSVLELENCQTCVLIVCGVVGCSEQELRRIVCDEDEAIALEESSDSINNWTCE